MSKVTNDSLPEPGVLNNGWSENKLFLALCVNISKTVKSVRDMLRVTINDQ